MISVRRGSAVLRLNRFQLVGHHPHQQELARKDRAQLLDNLHQLRELVHDLLPLEAGEALELHLQNGLGLELGQAEVRHQALAGLGGRLRPANEPDDLVEAVQRDAQPLEDVGPRLGLAKLELGPAPDDLATKLDELLDELEQVQDLRPAAGDGQHDDAEGGLELRVLVEVVQDDLWHLSALQLDDDPHAVAVRLVAQVGDPLDRLLAHQVRDVLDQPLLVDLVGNLGDDDRLPVALRRHLDVGLRPYRDRPAPVAVGLHDAGSPDDDAAGGKVRAGDDAEQLAEALLARRRALAGLRWTFGQARQSPRLLLLLDDVDDPVDHLRQVVRRHVGRHADGDARRPVDQEVRYRGRQNRRFFRGLVVVGDEVDRLLLQVGHQVVGQPLEPRLRVAHRRRQVPVDRAEVPLAVHQGIAHVELLRQPDERVVDRGVPVRVEVAHHLADNLGALAVPAIARQSHVAHAVQHAPVRGLQAVADVGKRATDDHAHGVIHVRALHLVFDVDGNLRGGEFHRTGYKLQGYRAADYGRGHYTSRFFTSSALSSMNFRRGSTWSPMSVVNIRSASAWSSART